jgi:PAS domain S-box-containing protein
LALINVVWKHGVSVRQQQATSLLQTKTAELSKQTNLLNSISDNTADLILLVDEQDNILFINQAFANLSQADPTAIVSKDLSNLLGPDPAETLQKFYHRTRELHHKHLSLQLGKHQYEFLATSVKIDYGDTGQKAHLVSLHDITKLNEKLRQNENLMRQTIQALMRAIDQHDPYSANHSAKTTMLVDKIARSMNVSEHDRQGLRIAATLCNLGKLSISKDVLSKTGELTSEEKELLAKETSFAAEILTDVDFSWPVAETISLKTEFLDGSGTPKGLSANKISRAGRILATANSFIAMTSPRAYREKLSTEEALNQLLELSDTLYDRKIVAALFNIIENESSEDTDS